MQTTETVREAGREWRTNGYQKWIRVCRDFENGGQYAVALLIQQRGTAFRCVVREGSAQTFVGYKGGLREAKTHLDACAAKIKGCR